MTVSDWHELDDVVELFQSPHHFCRRPACLSGAHSPGLAGKLLSKRFQRYFRLLSWIVKIFG
jgi:hypothetical protein